MTNIRYRLWWTLSVAVWCNGCDHPTASPVSSQSSPPPALSAHTVMPSDAPPALPAAPADSPADSASRIRLSTGIALAQTLPDGTSVLCSFDYQWVSGGAQQGVEYIWVIELGNGQRMTGPAKVTKPSGRIEAILHRVKPDQGPFKAAVFARSASSGLAPEQISDFVNLTK